MSKICTIFHDCDLDGWMSAAIVKHWFINYNMNCKINDEYYTANERVITNKPDNTLHFIGYNYGQPIPDLSEYDQVIMCDISFPKQEMGKLLTKLNGNLIWIDHHISAINDNKELMSVDTLYGLRDTKFAACELTWKYFFPNDPMPEIVRLLGMYDSFRHKGTDEETKVLEFQYGARQCISNYEEAYNYLHIHIEASKGAMLSFDISIDGILNKGKTIHQYLCTEAKQVYKNGFEIGLIEPIKDLSIGTGTYIPTRKFICINKERFNPINFGIDYHADGYDGAACFHYDGVAELWRFSLYNDNGEVDCSAIAKQFGGGGHAGASGFICNDVTFFKIINNE